MSKGIIFAKKRRFFEEKKKKKADISKIKKALVRKGIFSKTKYVYVYLHAKLQVSSIILKSFRQEGNFPPSTSKRTPKKPTQIRVKEILEKNKSLTVHYCNIHTLCTELYKIYNNLPPTIFSDLFIRNHISYNLHSQSKAVCKGSSSLQYFEPIIWNLMEIK